MDRIILGIDPGTATTGFGVINANKNEVVYINCGYIATSPKDQPADRLLIIAKSLEAIIKEHKPQLAAVENLFFAKNRATAMAVAQARGVILSTIAKHKISLVEYTPLQIKQVLTGYGKADKAQIQKMVKSVLKLDSVPKPDDSADALAIAICAAYSDKPVVK